MKRTRVTSCALLLVGLVPFARIAAASELIHWNISGVDRQALVVAPADRTIVSPPLLLVFHGHGGNMYFAERGQAFHERWPEAVVVYPEGLPTLGYLHDAEGRFAGWQHDIAENGDRDLKFVDAIIATMRDKFSIDQSRIYATGFSNGVFLLPALGGAAEYFCRSSAGSSANRAVHQTHEC